MIGLTSSKALSMISSLLIFLTRIQKVLVHQHPIHRTDSMLVFKAKSRMATELDKIISWLGQWVTRDEEEIASKKVLIGMFTYQGEKWIDEAIESVFELNHSNWHLLIVDDGSKDGTPHKIREWKKRYPQRISDILLAENRAPYNTINLGLEWLMEHPEYEVFTILDQDDVIVPDALHKGLRLMGKSSQVVRCKNARYNVDFSEWFYDYFATTQLFIHREVIQRIGLRLERSVVNPSDAEYLSRIFHDAADMGYAVISTQGICQKMRVHGDNQILGQKTKTAIMLRDKLGLNKV